MHEAALFRDLRGKLLEIGSDHPGELILRVRVQVGALSHVSPSAVAGAWAEITRGTPAEGAALITQELSDPYGPGADLVVLSSVDLGPAPTGTAPEVDGPQEEQGRAA